MRRLARLFGWALAGTFVSLLFTAVITARYGDASLWPPKDGGAAMEIFVVSHGYHAGVVVSRPFIAELAGRQGHAALIEVTQRFSGFSWLEIGWGDEGFYTSVPNVSALTLTMASRALFRPGNPSVLHVVGLNTTPDNVFPSADIAKITLSEQGADRLVAQLEWSFARTGTPAIPQAMGVGLYGPSQFYRAVGSFNIFSVCNHWVADLLSAAGLPTTPVLDTLPPGLLFDLRIRSGVRTLSPASKRVLS